MYVKCGALSVICESKNPFFYVQIRPINMRIEQTENYFWLFIAQLLLGFYPCCVFFIPSTKSGNKEKQDCGCKTCAHYPAVTFSSNKSVKSNEGEDGTTH